MRTQFSTTRVWMAGVLAVCMAAGAVHEAGREAGEVIQPKTIHAGEPFTFAVRGSATGEVIEVKTVSGEVVHQGKPDKLGRVFLAAGLPAGAYLVTSALHHTSQNMVVAPATPLTAQAEPLRLDRIQEAINVSEPLRLNGYGFSPKAADMTVNGAPVLAATSNEIVTGPNTQKPGMQELTVVNQSTGETVKSDPVLAYDLQGHLEQRKLITGQQTALRLNFEPKNVPVMVRAAVTKGPVNFGQGRTETLVAVNNGAALVPVHANIGSSGPFELEWFFEKVMETVAKIATDTPRALLQKKADACAAASALSENSQNRKDLSKEAELDGKAAKDGKNWNKDGTPKDLKKFGDFLNAEIARLEKIAKKEGGGAAAGKIAEAIGAAYDAGTAAGLDLKSGKK